MKRLLIANRGEIACRIARTARRMGLGTVAVHSDADAGAPHVRAADAAVALPGSSSADTYLRIHRLLDAARSSGADAVHPGYGFLSENADFAQAVVDAGLIWVGPPPAAIRALGSKSASKAIAQAHGIPCLDGYFGADQRDERFAAEAARIGYPVMVKAAAGGGGRGMRLAPTPEALSVALASARTEAASAFGSAELLIERAVLAPRHVEVQVFADGHGQCIHLGERDCSVQRRHQKLVEETPSPAVDPGLRKRLCHSAVRLAQAAGYVGAGTVEFLVEGDRFFLMEMNTRLQVEHPVTEMVTGLDLVEWQLRVARGERLPLTQDEVRFDGHAIEVRLCAEDEQFVPHAGPVSVLVVPPGAQTDFGAMGARSDLRFDHGLARGWQVPAHYDSMLGKLIVHAPTRALAIQRLVHALDELVVLGLPTNRAMLQAILGHEHFAAGRALIPFLSEAGAALIEDVQKREQEMTDWRSLSAILFENLGTGRLVCPYVRPVRWRHRGRLLDVPVDGLPERPSDLCAARVAHTGAAGASTRWHVQHRGVELWLEDASHAPPERDDDARGPRELRAPFNGKVVALPVAVGQAVARGDTIAIVESMKIEHRLPAPAAGVLVDLTVAPGQQVATGHVLARIDAARVPATAAA